MFGDSNLSYSRPPPNKKRITSHNIIYIGLSPLPVTVTTRIITFLVGDPYKPSFATVTGTGDNPTYTPLEIYYGYTPS